MPDKEKRLSTTRQRRLEQKIERALQEKSKQKALYRAMERGRNSRQQRIASLPGQDAFRQVVREIKQRCQSCRQELLETFVKNAKKRGTHVFLAQDGQAAIDYILALARRHQAKTIAKSKSLTSEEIEVNAPLEEAGLRVIETDLGELIIQKFGEKPYHLVFPSVHKTAGEVAEVFSQATGKDVPPNPQAIMDVVRAYLRPIFLDADIGMTGANIGIANTGAIVIETNEGNARLVSSVAPVHVCIMGTEKIVETLADALPLMRAHPVSATGQYLTTYVTLMAGRSPLGQGAPPRESHLILLDNGRAQVAEDPELSDALNCIRCGACMNICPTYGVVGGHVFGHIYPGPIGIPWTAGVHGLDKAGEFASLCISCGLCQEICPVDIDIPTMIATVKHRDMAQHPQPWVNRAMMQAESLAKVGSATAPLSNWLLKNRIFRVLLEKTVGVERKRQLPAFQRQTLKKRFKNRAPSGTPKQHKVAFFADIYAAYNAPELGMAVVDCLEKVGCEVVLPEQRSSGYPLVGYGDLDRARKVAQFNVKRFAAYAQAGYDIVTTEPTAAYCLRKTYPKLLKHSQRAQLVAEKTFELFEYLLVREAEVPTPYTLSSALSKKRFGFHISCHQRPLNAAKAAMAWLKQRGVQVQIVETGTCCGMGGTFGLKTGALGYDLAQAVGEPLFEAFERAEVDAILTESSVCRMQLQEGTALQVYHPLEVLSELYEGDR